MKHKKRVASFLQKLVQIIQVNAEISRITLFSLCCVVSLAVQRRRDNSKDGAQSRGDGLVHVGL
jgi:hypothetical protein